MRFCRAQLQSGPHYARIDGDWLVPLSKAPWDGGQESGQRVPMNEASLLVPTEATKVVAVARNYRKHAEELFASP